MSSWGMRWPLHWRIKKVWNRWKGLWWQEKVGLGIGSVGSNERGWDWTCSWKKICAKMRNCSQEGGEKKELGNKRNMGGDGNEFHRSSGSPSANAVEFLPSWRVETLHHARKLNLLFLVPETSGEQSGASIWVSSPLDALEASAGSCDGEAGNAAFLHPLPDIVTEEFDKHVSYCGLFCCPFGSLYCISLQLKIKTIWILFLMKLLICLPKRISSHNSKMP